MKRLYKFCLLQYHHSFVLGEVVNLGILIFFPKEKRIEFFKPENLDRLIHFYKDFPEKTILKYYSYFNEKTKELNSNFEMLKKYEADTTLEKLTSEEFLATDSSIIRFGKFSGSILYSMNYELILDNLSITYFPIGDLNYKNFNLEMKTTNKKEDWISLDFKNKISRINVNDVFLPGQDDLSF